MKLNLFASLGVLLSLSTTQMSFAGEGLESLDSGFLSATGSYAQDQDQGQCSQGQSQGQYNQYQDQGQCGQSQGQYSQYQGQGEGQYSHYQGQGQYNQYQGRGQHSQYLEQDEQPLVRGKGRCYAQDSNGTTYSETGSRFRIRHLQRHALRKCQSSGLPCNLFGCRIM